MRPRYEPVNFTNPSTSQTCQLLTNPSTFPLQSARANQIGVPGALEIQLIDRSRAKVARMRRSQPDSGLGYWTKVLKPFKVVPASLGGGQTCCAFSRSIECATYKAVKARFWPWLEPFFRQGSLKHYKLPPRRSTADRPSVARCATLARSQDVCKRSQFTVEGERCVVSS